MESPVDSFKQVRREDRGSRWFLYGLALIGLVALFLVPFVPRLWLVAGGAGLASGLMLALLPRDPDTHLFFGPPLPGVLGYSFFFSSLGESLATKLCYTGQFLAIWWLTACLVARLLRR